MSEVKLHIYSADLETVLKLDYADGGVKAGFPSPAQDYITESIDFNRDLIKHPQATFYARAIGNSMIGKGIDDGDLLVIDRLIEPQEGHIVVAFVDGEFTLKTFHRDEKEDCVWLLPANPDYPPLKVTEGSEFKVWGVLVYNIKNQLLNHR